MSVLVKGMEMPKHCAECGFLEAEYTLECNCLRKKMQGIFEGRDRDCPLVEVHTPHGRLIDADETMRQWGLDKATKYGNENAEQQLFSYSTMMMYEIVDIIDDAPTVIEAEE